MNWNKGYTAACYCTLVDSSTWRDLTRIEITGGSVSRSSAVLRESATVNCVNYDQTAERWLRVWMDVKQAGASDRVAIFTGLASSPDRDINGRITANAVALYSVLKPAQDILLPRGWYAPAGVSGAEMIAKLLAVTPAPVEIDGDSPALLSAYVAEDGENNLSMAQKLLDAINWRLRIAGDGTVTICPKPETPAATFDCLENDSIEPRLQTTYDWFSCPNVFRVVQGDTSVTIRDENPDSPFSTISRGREIWAEGINPALNAGESLVSYASRRLKEMQQAAYTVSYDRRYHPDVTVGDIVSLRYPEQEINGTFTVESQSVALGAGCKTAEDVSNVIVYTEKAKELAFPYLVTDDGYYIIDSDGNRIFAFTED